VFLGPETLQLSTSPHATYGIKFSSSDYNHEGSYRQLQVHSIIICKIFFKKIHEDNDVKNDADMSWITITSIKYHDRSPIESYDIILSALMGIGPCNNIE
jgi:hypothetical protein